MFRFSEKTQDGRTFKMLDLYKLIKANKDIKKDAEVVSGVVLKNILSPETTMLEESENVKEIYIMEINLKTKRVPSMFLEALNKAILLQTLFVIRFEDKVQYMISLKELHEEGLKVLKTFETDWVEPVELEFPITTKLETIFRSIVRLVAGYSFRADETFADYIARVSEIKKKKQEVEKLNRMMIAEKQPNKKMAYNNKIKLIKQEISNMEDCNG